MEKSIKRVEKLVHATNTALAQMKYSLTFDDLSEEPMSRFWDKKAEEERMKIGQQEFRTETSEMLLKVEKLLHLNNLSSARKSSTARNRIKDINRKMEALKLEKERPKGIGQSRQKLLCLTNEEDLKNSEGLSSRGSVTSQQTAVKEVVVPDEFAPRKSDSGPTAGRTPVKSREELKSKILETQKIVDRGFQTVRQLTQKVENITTKCEKKSPSSGKTDNEAYVKSLDQSQNSGSQESGKINERSCCRHSKRYAKKEESKGNNRVFNVRRIETQRTKRSNLEFQRLPSLHIKGGLQMQVIHNFEILPGNVNTRLSRPNTATNIISHEEIEKERAGRFLEEIKKWHLCESDRSGSYVECSNCGKLVRVQETAVDPKKLEEVLRQCDFNVFDSRIDEFVEKHNHAILEEKPKEEPAREESSQPESSERTFKMQHLSEQLSRRYKQEADTLEVSHLKLDSVLQDLFKKASEFREVFEDCRLLSKKQATQKLTATKPVIVSLTGSYGKSWQKKCRKLDKKDLENQKKSRTPEYKPEDVNVAEEVKVSNEREAESVQITNEIIIPSECQAMAISTSEISENDYESDFEGDSDLAEDKNNVEEEKLVKKLSTISEVDSDLEKKTSDDTFKDLTARSSNEAAKNAEAEFITRKPSEIVPPPVRAQVKAQETHSSEESEKNIKNGSKTSLSQRSSPTELVTSLKDILSALRDQFARTESLAEKLTENAKSPMQDIPPESWGWLDNPRFLTKSLSQATKKEADRVLHSGHYMIQRSDLLAPGGEGKQNVVEKIRETSVEDDLTDDAGSSVGEVLAIGGMSSSISECTPMQTESEGQSSRLHRKKQNGLIMGVKSEEISYSEGEIPSNVLLESECGSVHSVGEAFSERTSRVSTVGVN